MIAGRHLDFVLVSVYGYPSHGAGPPDGSRWGAATVSGGQASHGMIPGCVCAVKYLADFLRPALAPSYEEHIHISK